MCHKTSRNTHKLVCACVRVSGEEKKGEKGAWKKEEKERKREGRVARTVIVL